MCSDEQIAANVLRKVLDTLCDKCLSSSVENKKHIYAIPDSFRSVRRRSDEEESMISEHVVDADSDEDSEEEFNRILASTRARWKQQADLEDDDEESFVWKRDVPPVEHEYDGLPAIEQLSIHVEDTVPLKSLGNITSVVDCLVVVQANSNIALDFDTILFDSQRNAIGKIYDILGAVSAPLYAIRFNSAEDAQSYAIGLEVFYAPTDIQFTHHVFMEQLRKEKVADPCWDGEGECPVDELAFSDDESEKRYKAKHRRKKANISSDPSENDLDAIEEKRPCAEGLSGRERGRGAWRRRGRGIAGPFRSKSFPNRGFHSSMAWPPSTSNRSWSGQPQWHFSGASNGNQALWNDTQNSTGDSRLNNPSFQPNTPRGYNSPFLRPPRFANFGRQHKLPPYERQQFASGAMSSIRPNLNAGGTG